MTREIRGIFSSSPPSAMIGVLSMLTIAIIGILVAIVIPNLLSPIQRGRQKTTMARMQQIGDRLEQLRAPAGYPVIRTIDALHAMDKTMPMQDGWDRPFRIISGASGYCIVSAGQDGRFEQDDPQGFANRRTVHFEEDIVFCTGRFVREPEGSSGM